MSSFASSSRVRGERKSLTSSIGLESASSRSLRVSPPRSRSTSAGPKPSLASTIALPDAAPDSVLKVNRESPSPVPASWLSPTRWTVHPGGRRDASTWRDISTSSASCRTTRLGFQETFLEFPNLRSFSSWETRRSKKLFLVFAEEPVGHLMTGRDSGWRLLENIPDFCLTAANRCSTMATGRSQ